MTGVELEMKAVFPNHVVRGQIRTWHETQRAPQMVQTVQINQTEPRRSIVSRSSTRARSSSSRRCASC